MHSPIVFTPDTESNPTELLFIHACHPSSQKKREDLWDLPLKSFCKPQLPHIPGVQRWMCEARSYWVYDSFGWQGQKIVLVINLDYPGGLMDNQSGSTPV